MRWNRNAPPPPKDGDDRRRRVFAWTPTEVNDKVVWLERYEVFERYKKPLVEYRGRWVEVCRSTIDVFF